MHDPNTFVDIIYSVSADGIVTFPGRQLKPVRTRSGKRTLTRVVMTPIGRYRACFVCACKRSDHIDVAEWRKGTAESECAVCSLETLKAKIGAEHVPADKLRDRERRAANSQVRHPITALQSRA